jgi:hypothetical protein
MILFGTFMIGVALIMNFIPIYSPEKSSAEIARIYAEDATRIRIGCVLTMFGFTFWATWAVAIAAMIRMTEKGVPALTYAAVCLTGGNFLIFELMPLTWALAAYRPESIDPGITQTLNDFGWFCALFTWPPFTLFNVVIAMAIFADKNRPDPIYPRWVGYFSLWAGLLLVPAGLIPFWKSGPFAYDGLLAFYMVVTVFFIWMIGMTAVTAQAITREERRQVQALDEMRVLPEPSQAQA